MEQQNGTLYVVATPIGNLGDMSTRAIQVLSEVDCIAAEDTRTTAMLLEKYAIQRVSMLANHKFNEEAGAARIVSELLAGKSVALVTDAGTPCISDPGYVLVREAVKAGIPVTAVPGCCAATTAVVVSGFCALSFSFYGFLPRNAGDLRKVFARIASQYSPLSVFYESPNRILKTMTILGEVLPGSSVCLCNDLTKKFERIYRGSPAAVLQELQNNPNADKGEYALVIYCEDKPDQTEERFSLEAAIVDEMVKTGCSSKEAVSMLAARKMASKGDLYDASLRLKELL